MKGSNIDKVESAALVVVLLIVLGTPSSIYYYEFVYRPSNTQEILISGRMSENGGWNPAMISVKKGETVRLKIMGNDVTHGLAIPELGINTGPIAVGEVKTIEFLVNESGTFTFYCTVLCSPKHYLMTGMLTVEGGE